MPDGTVDKVDLIKSSGFTDMDSMAIQSAKETKYSPVDSNSKDKEKLRIFDIEIEFSQIK